ncbi:hypothetical protein [Prosthecobacter sp.]|uniref:hypothetical protein n=1 Tax=Prosthecobacter sp. TaxID=1965333 RepID=UPI00378506A5
MKMKLMLAALLASAAFAQATPAITPAKSKASLHLNNVKSIFHRSVQRPVTGPKVANGPFLNHPDSAPGPH